MHDLDDILMHRAVPPTRDGLADRIVLQTLEQSQKPIGFWAELRMIFETYFLIPKPAYIVAAAILLGAVIGLDLESLGAPSQLSTYEFASLIDVQEQFETGEFL